MYYKFYGHPWKGINGPNKIEQEEMLIRPHKDFENVHETELEMQHIP